MPLLDPETVAVVMSALEAPVPTVSAQTFQTMAAGTRVQLITAGLLKPDGHEPVLAIGDNYTLVTLSWSDEQQRYGYFEPRSGWTAVPHEAIIRYRVDVLAVIAACTKRLRFVSRPVMSPVVSDCLWEIGSVRRHGRHVPTVLLFGRRLFDRSNWTEIATRVQARGAGDLCLLTSTRRELLPDPPVGVAMVSLPDLLRDRLELDPLAISGSSKPPTKANGPLVVTADGKEVIFFGQTFRFPRGTQQRRIVCYLYNRSLEGELAISEDRIAADLELRDGFRMRDTFKDHPAWGNLLTVRDGLCEFCWPEK
jgi:hypothetical protein